MTFHRLSKSRSRNDGRESLLLDPEPAGDAYGGLKKDYRTASSNSGSSSGGSHELAMAAKYHRSPTTADKHRFMPQPMTTTRREDSSYTNGEAAPAERVLQFVPAYDDNNDVSDPTHSKDTSWDAILDDGAAAFPAPQPRVPGTRSEIDTTNSHRFRRRAVPSLSRSTATSIREDDNGTVTEVMSPTTRTKGPRIARLAALFSRRQNNNGDTRPNEKNNNKCSPNSTNSTLPNSPSRSSSSGDYVGWPGTENKRGGTVAIQSSYEDSDIGPKVAGEDQDLTHTPFLEDPEQKAWMESPAFQDISRVSSDPPGEKVDDVYEDDFFPEPPHGVPINRLFSKNSEWEIDAPSPSRSSFSKTSSAYFDNDIARPAMAFPSFQVDKTRRQAANIMRGAAPQPPTEETLALNNSFSPPHRIPSHARGFRGLLDKTQEVPNLMDNDSDSVNSSRSSNVHSAASAPSSYYNNSNDRAKLGIAMPRVNEDSESDVFDEISKYSLGDSRYSSELFDGILSQSVVEESKASLSELRNTTSSVERRNQKNQQLRNNDGGVKVVLLGGGLTTIQTTAADFSRRIKASDYDETLTNSDIDVPSFQEMAEAGRSVNDSSSVIDTSRSVDPTENRVSARSQNASMDYYKTVERFEQEQIGCTDACNPVEAPRCTNTSELTYQDDESAFFSDFYSGDEVSGDGDLSQYYVQPSLVKKLVRKYRRMCRQMMAHCHDDEELERAEDEKQIFALFEMRSRIMEKDIERGLERRGGTVVVDDLVLTKQNRRAMRIRDAVIVSKAWRDGASPMDVINTAHLTERVERSYFICRPSLFRVSHNKPQYRWEEVTWIDDTDFSLYKCPSLGSRHLRGPEMFTIGDCQSILLKLTNQSCMDLRSELNHAMARQIEAEELMREEGDQGDGIMTEAEMSYLTSMEEVKTLSKKLVVAEKAFALVRDRIKKLIAKYEDLLVKIDMEDMATGSVVTAASSCYSDEFASRVSTDFDQEERAWQRRQQRAEISAELSAREALLARQGETYSIQEERQRELERLHHELIELQSEPSANGTDRQRSALLAKVIASKRQSTPEGPDASTMENQPKEGGVDSVKQKFRERTAARKRQNLAARQESKPGTQLVHTTRNGSSPTNSKPIRSAAQHSILSLAGEEMFQYLDFYERSLQAVEHKRDVYE